MKEKIVYQEGKISLGKLKTQHEDEKIHVCPVCGSDLIIVLSEEEARKSNFGKGIFCPIDLQHVNVKILGRRRNLSS